MGLFLLDKERVILWQRPKLWDIVPFLGQLALPGERKVQRYLKGFSEYTRIPRKCVCVCFFFFLFNCPLSWRVDYFYILFFCSLNTISKTHREKYIFFFNIQIPFHLIYLIFLRGHKNYSKVYPWQNVHVILWQRFTGFNNHEEKLPLWQRFTGFL